MLIIGFIVIAYGLLMMVLAWQLQWHLANRLEPGRVPGLAVVGWHAVAPRAYTASSFSTRSRADAGPSFRATIAT